MSGLVDSQGLPLTRQISRREMKSGQVKRTRFGDVLFKLTVDIPDNLPEDDFIKVMYEYGNIVAEAYKKKM